MRSGEMGASLADMRNRLCREYHLTGHEGDRAVVEEAILAVSVAEERVNPLLSSASV